MAWLERVKSIGRLLKYTLVFPGLAMYFVQQKFYLTEQRRISEFLQNRHQAFVVETQRVIQETGAALQKFTEVTTFPPLEMIKQKETRKSLRERCIFNGISPQVYNEFYQSVDKTEQGLSLNDMLARDCEKSKEKCEGFASVAQLLLA